MPSKDAEYVPASEIDITVNGCIGLTFSYNSSRSCKKYCLLYAAVSNSAPSKLLLDSESLEISSVEPECSVDVGGKRSGDIEEQKKRVNQQRSAVETETESLESRAIIMGPRGYYNGTSGLL